MSEYEYVEYTESSEKIMPETGISSQIKFPKKQEQEKENKMADYTYDTTLHTEHAAIRHDIGLAEANIRDAIGREACAINANVGDTKYEVGNQAGRLAQQIGAEACAINKHIGDTRQEDAENFGHTRRDIMQSSGDIRQEVTRGMADTRFAGAQNAAEIRGDIKDARYDLYSQIDGARDSLEASSAGRADRIVDRIVETKETLNDRFFTVGRDLMDLRQGQLTLAKDVELNALKTQLDAKENTRYIVDKLQADGEKTRGLINDLKYHDLNRSLVERNAELVECESDRRYWRRHAEQNQYGAQFAQLQSQIQAFNSQLQETRQGIVNFGNMERFGQTSTTNAVR